MEGRGKFLPVTTGAGGAIVFGSPYTRRTPLFVQSDLSVTHTYKVSDTHEAWRLGFEADILNALNTKRATIFNTRLDTGNLSAYVNPSGLTDANGNLQYGVLESAYDYQGLTNSKGLTLNGEYGQPTNFQTGRTIRIKGKFTF